MPTLRWPEYAGYAAARVGPQVAGLCRLRRGRFMPVGDTGIAQAKTKIEQRARERHAVEQQEYEAKCDKWQGQCDEGKKPRGPDPKPPSSEPKAGDQVKLSDEASRIMQSSRGGFEQSYNAQAAVDTQTMRVVATKAGRGLYRLRKQTVAPVFGIIKRVMGWSQLNMGGLDNARGEWLLGACRAWGVESEKRPQRGQFLPDLQAHSSTMGQKAGEKWSAEAVSQPTFPKSDRLLGRWARPQIRPATSCWAGGGNPVATPRGPHANHPPDTRRSSDR